ncbi:unnamed protein product [Cuscuta campestris]|uniref:Leucine-rich repeat-containing N-terminal plant-type domain-containing protein n=1 Tax=Cuscuta campestris TaxID=132261 RepID=A0A484LJJ9_9ASTE|nr:unnamed protein product [Cuscuta campestris]
MSSFSLIIPILALSLLLPHNAIGQKCNPKERDVLLKIKAHFKIPPSLSSWDPNTTSDCSFWDGIGADDQGHVTRLRINNANDIAGPIPPFLDGLPFLKTLDFSGVPNLSGPIPTSIGNFRNLTSLTISGSKVTGPIPLGSVGRLTTLDMLDLRSNRLNGSIPSDFSRLTRLTYFNLNSNLLSGPIPDFMGRKLTKLNYIGLESNRLSGPIPASFGLLPVLTTLHLSKNQLAGPIPDPLGRVGVMSSVDISHNAIAGDASFLFDKKYTALSFLYVNDNMLKFDFSDVELTPTLAIFNVSHNMIHGSLPRRFGQMKPDINYVDVSFNRLCGPIPNGRRFKKADPAIFAHNKCLCGGPLPACK